MLTPFGLAIYQARGVIIECLLGMCKSRKLLKQRKKSKIFQKKQKRDLAAFPIYDGNLK